MWRKAERTILTVDSFQFRPPRHTSVQLLIIIFSVSELLLRQLSRYLCKRAICFVNNANGGMPKTPNISMHGQVVKKRRERLERIATSLNLHGWTRFRLGETDVEQKAAEERLVKSRPDWCNTCQVYCKATHHEGHEIDGDVAPPFKAPLEEFGIKLYWEGGPKADKADFEGVY